MYTSAKASARHSVSKHQTISDRTAASVPGTKHVTKSIKSAVAPSPANGVPIAPLLQQSLLESADVRCPEQVRHVNKSRPIAAECDRPALKTPKPWSWRSAKTHHETAGTAASATAVTDDCMPSHLLQSLLLLHQPQQGIHSHDLEHLDAVSSESDLESDSAPPTNSGCHEPQQAGHIAVQDGNAAMKLTKEQPEEQPLSTSTRSLATAPKQPLALLSAAGNTPTASSSSSSLLQTCRLRHQTSSSQQAVAAAAAASSQPGSSTTSVSQITAAAAAATDIPEAQQLAAAAAVRHGSAAGSMKTYTHSLKASPSDHKPAEMRQRKLRARHQLHTGSSKMAASKGSSSSDAAAAAALVGSARLWQAVMVLLTMVGLVSCIAALLGPRLVVRDWNLQQGKAALPATAAAAATTSAAGAARYSDSAGSRASSSKIGWGGSSPLLGAAFRAASPSQLSRQSLLVPGSSTRASSSSSRLGSSSWVRFAYSMSGARSSSIGSLASPWYPAAGAARSAAAAAGGAGPSEEVAAAAADVPGTSSSGSSKPQPPPGAITMYAVVDEGVVSPYKGATWGAVLRHISKRLSWNNPLFNLEVIGQQQLHEDAAARARLLAELNNSSSSSGSGGHQIFVGVAISNPEVVSFISAATRNVKTALFWDSDPQLSQQSRVDGFAPATAGPLAQLLAQRVGFSGEARAARVFKTLDSLWGRHTSDDLTFIWLVLLNEYIMPVPEVADTTKGTDLPSLVCMIRNCGRQIVDCVTDTSCKAGLDCLEGCAFNDQVCQYRCIVSYETPKFEQFALCILQLHNCRNLNAQMPKVPDPAPLTHWRGQPLTHEMAEQLFIGWMSSGPQLPDGTGQEQLKPYSWLVAAGKNPAYDYFPCQHQLYYAGRGRGQLWYEPVFKAITLDGQEVWRRRKYRVRRGTTPGTFFYSVLDNGVTSNEYWRIMDCANDLTWCLFYYSGAAATAGLSYNGAVLATVDGRWPEKYTARVHEALGRAGIEPWELSSVDNSNCVGAPL